MILNSFLLRSMQALCVLMILFIMSPMGYAESDQDSQLENSVKQYLQNRCTCQFKSKHYDWKNSGVSIEDQTSLFQIKHKLVWSWKSDFYETTSRFRCVYECVDTYGESEMVEYVQTETRPGYFDGGLTAAKKFHCSASTPALSRKYSHYQTEDALAFKPSESTVDKIRAWSQEKGCGVEDVP